MHAEYTCTGGGSISHNVKVQTLPKKLSYTVPIYRAMLHYDQIGKQDRSTQHEGVFHCLLAER